MAAEKEVFKLDQPHGLGEVFISWQRGSGTFLATTGPDHAVTIYNRHGKRVEQMRLPGACTGFGWDSDGDLLACISANSPHVVLWDSNSGKRIQIDTGLRDPLSCVVWAKTGALLAVGTARGNVAIYNHGTAKRIPVLGKHSRRISCGAWSREGLLALGSEDRSLSISSSDGDTLRLVQLRAEPSDIHFSEMKLDERAGGENTVSVVVGRKTLFLYNLHDPDNPVELAFQQRYGGVVTYKWFGDGYILVGFSVGHLVAISTHLKEVGQELFQVKSHRDALYDLALSPSGTRLASCGDNELRLYEVSDVTQPTAVLALEPDAAVERLSWSGDGQLVAVATRGGSVHVFLAQLPLLHASHGAQLAMLSGLSEVSLYTYDHETKTKPNPSVVLPLPVEPDWLALGPYHCAAGLNNRAWYYEVSSGGAVLVREREYIGAVGSVRLGADHAAVLSEGQLHLHTIEPASGDAEEREARMFAGVVCHALTTDFLVYASEAGHLHYFSLEDWKDALEHRHTTRVRAIYPDTSGARLVLLDDVGEGYLVNPVREETLQVPSLPSSCAGVLWDIQPADKDVFVVYDGSEMTTYIHIRESVTGPAVEMVGTTKFPTGQVPLLVCGGQVLLASPGGRLAQVMLSTHEAPGSRLDQTLARQLALRRFDEAWKTCQVMNTKEAWERLGKAALRALNIEAAVQVYRHAGDVGMVMSLESLRGVEDQRLLAGHIAAFLQDFERAQDCYLRSSQPAAALNMRRDLLQWDQALQLAAKLAPEQMPYIAREYAQQLEFMGSYAEALGHYERGLAEVRSSEPPSTEEETHLAMCRAGVARTALRCGDIRRGVAIAADEASSRQLRRECADILESIKQLGDAAMLYEKGQYYDKAAAAYIRLKDWTKVGQLLPHVTSTKIHLQYAKAKEADGRYREAAEVYRAARDLDSVVRLCLEKLDAPEEAVTIVQETRSAEGARMVARFFQRLGDYRAAVRFLVLSRCHDEAFKVAREHGQLVQLGEELLESGDARPEDLRSLAVHFETEQAPVLAAKYLLHSGEHHKALKLLLGALKMNPEDSEAVQLAIDVVGAANDEVLANQLIEFLLGETDGVPKEPKLLFRLYMARRQFREAAKTAIIIANEEQVNGNYRSAHDLLLSMYRELRQNGLRVPAEMWSALALLHSYILVRLHVRRGDHLRGARMLLRVAANISKFPSHVVPILTSTVIECSRAGLRSSAFQYASMLMRPEYRPKLDSKYSRKIEAVVRRPGRSGGEEEDEPLSPCPRCDLPLAESELSCSHCKNTLPFCVATGRHVVRDDMTACPHCDFPAILSELSMIVEGGDACPMCSEPISADQLTGVADPTPYLHPLGDQE